MVQCKAARDEERCQKRIRLIAPKGVTVDSDWTCEGCKSGKAPFVARTSERKGQQKNAGQQPKKKR